MLIQPLTKYFKLKAKKECKLLKLLLSTKQKKKKKKTSTVTVRKRSLEY